MVPLAGAAHPRPVDLERLSTSVRRWGVGFLETPPLLWCPCPAVSCSIPGLLLTEAAAFGLAPGSLSRPEPTCSSPASRGGTESCGVLFLRPTHPLRSTTAHCPPCCSDLPWFRDRCCHVQQLWGPAHVACGAHDLRCVWVLAAGGRWGEEAGVCRGCGLSGRLGTRPLWVSRSPGDRSPPHRRGPNPPLPAAGWSDPSAKVESGAVPAASGESGDLGSETRKGTFSGDSHGGGLSETKC